MKPQSIIFLILAVVVVSATAAYMADSDSSDAATADSVRVFVEKSDGTYVETSSSGSSVKQIIQTACSNLNFEIKYTKLGAIESVGGVEASEDEYWNIHQWMPLGVHDWSSVGFDVKSDGQIISGTTYCLHMSEQRTVNQSTVYDVPNFKPESDGYVFIKFGIRSDDSSEEVQNAFTQKDRLNGFWIKGHGSNMGEVVENAMKENDFTAEFVSKTDSDGNDLQYWITSFFGIEGSTNMGSSMSWAYWSQYMYVDDSWTYNEWTLGYYDPGVYKYAACVYFVSVDYTEDSTEKNDVTSELPKITSQSDISAQCKKAILNVTFKLNGEVISEQSVRYGKAPIAPEVPADEDGAENILFNGWGSEVTKPVTEDKVFRATTDTVPDGFVQILYRSDEGKLLSSELLSVEDDASYNVTPEKEFNAEYKYNFTGWKTRDGTAVVLTSVTSSITVYASFESEVRSYKVTFVSGEEILSERDYNYGTSAEDIVVPVVPDVPVDAQYTNVFKGWTSEISDVTENVTYTAVFEKTVNKYTVIFDVNGQKTTKDYDYGTLAADLEVPVVPDVSVDAQYRNVFKGWTPEIADVTANITYAAVFEKTVNKYTVTFDVGGNKISKDYDYGTSVEDLEIPENPTKAADAQYTYTFRVWDSEIAKVTGTVTYTAVFDKTVNKYTVTFDVDGQKTSKDYDYGTLVADFEVPENPTKAADAQYTYTFKAWDSEIAKVTGDATYTAVFDKTVNKYTVTFDVDGQKTSKDYDYGTLATDIVVPTDLTKAADAQYTYTFKAWDSEIAKVTGDATYTAVFTKTVNQYTVTFDVDGQKTSKDYDYGTVITVPADPVKSSDGLYDYTFKAWAGYTDGMTVTQDTTITAEFSKDFSTNTKVDATVEADDGKATLTKEEVEYIIKYEKKTTVKSGPAKVEIPASVLSAASGKDVSVEIENVLASDLTDAQKAAVGSAKVISLELWAGTESFHDLETEVTVTISADQFASPANEKTVVYYVDGNGNTEKMNTVVNTDGSVTFTTTHFSYYFVGEVSESDDSPVFLIAVAVIIVLVVLGIAAVFIKRRGNKC